MYALLAFGATHVLLLLLLPLPMTMLVVYVSVASPPVSFRVTVYVPAAAYTCVGANSVDLPPSPNDQSNLSHSTEGVQPRAKMMKGTASPGLGVTLVLGPMNVLRLSGALEHNGLSMCWPGRV